MTDLKSLLCLQGRWLFSRLLRFDIMLLAIVMTITTIGFITLFRRVTVFRGEFLDKSEISQWRRWSC